MTRKRFLPLAGGLLALAAGAAGLFFARPAAAPSQTDPQTAPLSLALAAPGAEPGQMDQAGLVIRKRLNLMPSLSAQVSRSGGQLLIKTPNSQDRALVTRLVSQTGLLQVIDSPSRVAVGSEVQPEMGLILSSANLVSASAEEVNGVWSVGLTFNSEASEKLRSYAAASPGRWLTVAVDGRAVASLAAGSGLRIEPAAGRSEAEVLAAVLSGGPLPVSLQIQP